MAFRFARALRTLAGLQKSPALFVQATEAVKKLPQSPSNDKLLALYAHFKQGTAGDCTEPSPSVFQIKDRAKWDAWNKLKGTSQDAAKTAYVDLVVSLGGVVEGASKSESPAPAAAAEPVVLVEHKDNVATITMNRPKRYNAFNTELLVELTKALNDVAKSSAKIAVITGAGSYYSSGNDISNFITKETPAVAARNANINVRALVAAFIDFPKPLIAAVNGPAIGIGVTSLGLCDFVYASDKATFATPFTRLGLCAEGCSSFTFPAIVGPIRANEILVGDKKWTAHEAHKYGLITEVFEDALFVSSVKKRVAELAALPAHSLHIGKTVMRAGIKDSLHATNKLECDYIEQQWQSHDCQSAVAAFLKRK